MGVYQTAGQEVIQHSDERDMREKRACPCSSVFSGSSGRICKHSKCKAHSRVFVQEKAINMPTEHDLRPCCYTLFYLDESATVLFKDLTLD